MIHARDSCIQSCEVLGLLEGEGEKRKYIEDVHRTRSLLVRFRWLDCVVAEKSFERRIEKKGNLPTFVSQFSKEIAILRSSRGIQILDYTRGSFLKEETLNRKRKEIFQPVPFFF